MNFAVGENGGACGSPGKGKKLLSTRHSLLHVLRRRTMLRQPRLLVGTHLLRRRPRKMLKKLKLKPKRPGGLPKLNVPMGKKQFSDGAPLLAPSQIWCKLTFTDCSRSSLLTL